MEPMAASSVPASSPAPLSLLDVHQSEQEKACMQQQNDTLDAHGPASTGLYCEGIFDGWLCWNRTPAGQVANQSCPNFIPGFEPDRYAYKACNEDGQWFRSAATNMTWSNYTTCVNMEALLWHQQVTCVYKAGYCLSLVALALSLALLSYFRSLRCARIIIHMNLFASFAINNALWLPWYAVLDNVDLLARNGAGCQLLHVVLHYFLLTNYAWMLCEGLYLHTVLVSAFISESRLLIWLHVLGWGAPLLCIVPYSISRLCTPGQTDNCWTSDSPYMYILSSPVCISMVLNLLFLCNIVRVLLVKLRAGPHVHTSARPSRTAVQALRATLLLVPLLGLNYLLTPFRPPKNHPLEKAYDITAAITASFQGLSVTVLFCFCNGEVISQVKRKWKNLIFRPRANSCTATTVSYVAGEEKICLHKKPLPRSQSGQRHQPQSAAAGSTEKVNV